MQQNLRNNGRSISQFGGRFAADRKKMVIAFCLIGLMVFMWVRVLGKKSPAAAEAAFPVERVNAVQQAQKSKITFIELPHIKGRHDELSRDFFTVENWRDFIDTESRNSGDDKEVNTVSKDGFEGTSRLITEKLKLEVIELGRRVPHAFINGKLLMIGGKLPVNDGVNKYECEVLRIEKNTVCLRCGSKEVQLKLVQAIEEVSER